MCTLPLFFICYPTKSIFRIQIDQPTASSEAARPAARTCPARCDPDAAGSCNWASTGWAPRSAKARGHEWRSLVDARSSRAWVGQLTAGTRRWKRCLVPKTEMSHFFIPQNASRPRFSGEKPFLQFFLCHHQIVATEDYLLMWRVI